MTNTKIGIIIVAYKNPIMTSRFIKEELSKLTTPYSLVIVNNAATDIESKQLADSCNITFIKDNWDKQKFSGNSYLISTPENLGYAKGNNLGVRFLQRIGCFSHYLFSNDDVEICNANILETLIATAGQKSHIAGIGPRIINLRGDDQSPHQRYISPYRLIGWKLFPFLRKKRNSKTNVVLQSPKANYTYWVSGAFMLVKAQHFEKVGMFDTRTFLYYEEAILAERFKQDGWEFYYDPTVSVIHFEGSSTQNTPSKAKKKIERDSRTIYFKYYKNINPFTIWLLNKVL